MDMIATTLTLLLGIGIGAAAAWWWLTQREDRSSKEELEQQIEFANNKFDTYRSEVNEHFIKTAQLVSNLTDSYKEVHEYLANSAMHLSNLEISRSVIESGEQPSKLELDGDIEPPRDYAPKSPNTVGTLSEEFGLEKPALEEEQSSKAS